MISPFNLLEAGEKEGEEINKYIFLSSVASETMAMLLGGNSKLGAHEWSEIGNFICYRQLFRPKEVAKLKFIFKKLAVFLHM